MKTTVEIPDELLKEAKRVALRDAAFGGGGLVAGRSLRDWETIRDPELWTADRDFSRFPALIVRNPLLG